MKLASSWSIASVSLVMIAAGHPGADHVWVRSSFTPPAVVVPIAAPSVHVVATAHAEEPAPMAPAGPMASGDDDDMPIPADRDMPASSYSSNVVAMLGTPVTAMVDARSDIYSSTRRQPDGSRGGVLPASVRLPAGAGSISFGHVAGKVGCGTNDPMSGPDGGGCAGGQTRINSAGGFSGIVDQGSTQFLVGVFVADRAPRVAPRAINFGRGGVGHDFASLSPQLGQVFFIGDGHARGREQTFVVPPGATTLYLGIADAYAFQGDPGMYGDNKGGFRLSLTVSDH